MNGPLEKSAGVALITVLLVVAAATIAAVSISSRLQVDIRRTENLLRADQAWQHVLGMESWAKGQLIADFKNDQKNARAVDDRKEAWADTVEETVEGGTVKGEIIDQQGLFNLNNLLKQPPQNSQSQQLVPSPLDVGRFKQLLKNLNLDEVPVDDLVDALVDWLDENSTVTGMGGAEDDYYQALEPAYSTANRLMAHQSELLLVKGFTREIYQELAPFITALPVHLDVNVNTAEPEVLQSMFTGLDYDDAKDLVDEMKDTPFEKVGDFMFELAPFNLQNPVRDGLSVKSDYFRVKSIVKVGRARVAVTSLIKRTESGEAEVLHRLREDIF